MPTPTGTWPGILPQITPETAEFWAGAARGELIVDECARCRALIFPPRGFCRECRNFDIIRRKIYGSGIVYSFTVNHNTWWVGQDVPMSIALVEFPANPNLRLLGRLETGGDVKPAIGMEVTVGFDRITEQFGVPVFRPMTSDGGVTR